jgi:hypothetical protein
MVDAIKLLRAKADECERIAKQTPFGRAQAELYDIAAEWHWLAGEATKLLDRVTQLEVAKAA